MLDRLASYPLWLFAFSIGCFIAERLWPWRKAQRQFRPGLFNDLLFLIFNGELLGLALYGIYGRWLEPWLDAHLGVVFLGVARAWPLWIQIIVAIVTIDFLQWCVHILLHRVPPLWRVHQVHHSVVDGEMDFIVSFRFHWLETVVYKSLLYLPLAVLGFAPEAALVHAIFGTLIGHLNHSNLNLGRGWVTRIFNTPRMHIWHHDYALQDGHTKNFAIIFSAWDWIFGTAYLPDHPPERLGYAGDDKMPRAYLAQLVWPASSSKLLGSIGGGFLLALLFGLGTPDLIRGWLGVRGGSGPSSQPAKVSAEELMRPAALADAAILGFGAEAASAGWKHPEWMVTATELRTAIGSPRLVILDVRTADRFAQGHIPGAQLIDRSDYSDSKPIPGLSKRADELSAMLASRGATDRSVLVIYGDGGAEPYRLWWTIKAVLGLEARILDGGLQAWKDEQLPTDIGAPIVASRGVITMAPRARPALEHWPEVARALSSTAGAQLVDTRTIAEFDGEEQHPQAARAGRIPGAKHLDWAAVLGGLDDPRLQTPTKIRERFAAAAIDLERPIVAYCQSGTRSAVLIYALLELGVPEERALNYGGSWAEYSRSSEPIEP